ncbi:MAG TPA: RNA polymerase sigma factor [Planctomycetota bacterium]|jgi:RNA polymerase sigma-70 factor (ECF subfamily)
MMLSTQNSATVASEPMTLTQALSRLAEKRDPQAWEALLAHSGSDMLRVTRRITGDPALAEDACQETLLQIRDHARAFTPPKAPQDAQAAARAWVMRVATYTALDLMRSRDRSRRREQESAHMATESGERHATNPAAAQLNAEQSAMLRREVAGLPDGLQQAVVLRFYGELDYRDVGVALSCSAEAAKKRVQRGLERLRDRLALLGCMLTLAQVLSELGSGTVQAAEAGRASLPAIGETTSANAVSPSQQAAWSGLLNSNAAPARKIVIPTGGLSLMAKISMGVAALTVIVAGVVAVQHSGAEEAQPPNPKPKAVTVVPSKTAPAEGAAKTPGVTAPVAEEPWKADTRQKLARKVSFEFVDTRLEEAVQFVNTLAKVGIVIAPEITAQAANRNKITLRVTDMSMENALKWTLYLAGLEYEYKHPGLWITARKNKPIEPDENGGSDEPWRLAIKTALSRKVTFEFVDTPLTECLAFLSSLTKVNFIVDPEAAKENPRINLRVADMQMDLALSWILKLTEMDYMLKDEAVFIARGKDLPKAHPAQPAPVKPPAPPKEKTGDF